VAPPAGLSCNAAEQVQESVSIGLAPENRLLSISARCEVEDAAGELDPDRAGHWARD
jgi:hypothetical protein